MTEIKVPGSSNAFIDVEADLIKVFEKRYGEYPILNYRSGNSNDKNHNYIGKLAKPFHNDPSIKRGWRIAPMEDNEWFTEISE